MSHPIIDKDGNIDIPGSRAVAKRGLIESWIRWENAKAEFSNLKASYTTEAMTDLELGIALDRAGSDDRIKKAIKDTAYFRAETEAYAAIITAMTVRPTL